MAFTSIINAASNIAFQTNRSSSKLGASLQSLASGKRINQAFQDIAAFSVATGLQSQNSTLRAEAQNIAQATSLLQVADGGLGQIGNILDRLTQISTQANSGALTNADRQALNTEFQELSSEIDRIAANTNFNGVNLLDGSLPAEDGGAGDFSAATLFGGSAPDISTQTGAQNALNDLGAAHDLLAKGRATVGSTQEAFNFAAANIESTIVNQEAARATLEDTDIAQESTQSALASLQRQQGIAVQAQANRLLPNILDVL